ncbi:iron chelate uptake ABC transporter family permease subunit, partial [Clostridioides difficile]
NNLCKNRRNYGDGLWRISKTYFSMQNSMKQEPCDFSHGRFRFKTSDNRVLIPVVIFLGSIVTALCDLISRVILSPVELPISTITSLLGAPIVVMLLVKRKDRA